MAVRNFKGPDRCFHFCHQFRCPKRWYSSQSAQSRYLNYPLMEMVTDGNQIDVLEDLITPLARTPYDSQIIFKEGLVRTFLKNLRSQVDANYKTAILPMERSPIIDHYRHKDEFNFYIGLDGDTKTLGFFTGRPHFGEVYSVRPTNLLNIKEAHKLVTKVFEDFVKKSPLPACHRLDDGGYWRRITLRSNLKGDIMAILTVHPQDRCPEEIEKEKRELAQHFQDNGINLFSLYHQLSKHVRSTMENSVTSLVQGKPYIYESFLGNELRISPDSFFQVNVRAAEVMHEEVRKLAKLTTSSTLLDLCSGVGNFSISFRNDVRNCIGIECSPSSVEDALVNCKINNVNNCEFTIGKVEERLSSVLEMLSYATDIVVIANPGRHGLHPRVIKLLRRNPFINRIVYVSCDPENRFTRKNFVKLISPAKKKSGKPFTLKSLKPIDMFPHTFHYELLLLFER